MNTEIQKQYRKWEWRTILILMVGYALYYFVRKNFSIAIPAIEQELGITKSQLGIFLTLNGIIYGFSRFVNGLLVDRFSKKNIMALGLVLSAAVNLAICFSPKMNGVMNLLDGEGKATLLLVYLIGSLWVVNGYIQGMGVPPCVSLLANWVRPSELATKQSFWNASHSIGAGVVVWLCGVLLQKYGYSAWNLCFAVPAAISLIGAPMIYFGLKDSPSQVGLPQVEELDKAEMKGEIAEKPAEEKIDSAIFKKVINKMVFANPYIWIISISNFCIYIIRFMILDWGSSFLTQEKGMDISTAANVVASSELIGGILGMLLAGWVTDRFFKNKAHRTCFFCTVFATISFFIFWKIPSANWSLVFLVLSAFFIYGPQALYGTCASQQATKHAAGTGNGILGIFGYASTAVSGIVFGILADNYGWDSVFILSIVFGALGALVIALMWNAPADGYAKFNKLVEEEKKKAQSL